MKIVFVTLSILLILIHFFEMYSKRRILTVADLKIGKKKFVELVLHWCTENIHDNNTSFDLKIIYRKPTKIMGRYSYFYQRMEIYIDNKMTLIELIDTATHEYIHHLQGSPKKHSKKLPPNYLDDPMEIEARKMAEKFRNQCYDEIVPKVV